MRNAVAVVVPVLFAVGALLVLRDAPTSALPPPGPDGLYPGDHVLPDAVMVYDQIKLIDAPPSEVWPWVQQVGKGRGGRSTISGRHLL